MAIVAENTKMVFRQLFDRETCTYTYLIGDRETKEAVLIDPVLELVDRDNQVLKELGLELRYGINTHVHADHATATGLLKKDWPNCESVLGERGNEAAKADVKVKDGDVLGIGKLEFKFISTPGHTNGCHSIYMENEKIVFTGDTMLIRGCGRTDFQQGSSEDLYNNIHSKLFTLAEDTTVFPAHDYRGRTSSTIGEEKTFNPRLGKGKTLEEFVDIMNNLNLAYPKKIDAVLPLNLVCGLHELLPEDDEK